MEITTLLEYSDRSQLRYHSVLLVFEEAVGLVNAGEREGVGDQWGCVDLSLFDQGEDLRAVAAIHTSGLENKVLASLCMYMLLFCNVLKGDTFDFQAQDSGWGLGLGHFADLLAHQGSSDRRFQRDLAGLQVHLVGADYLKLHTGICREICEFHLTQKTDSVFWKCIRIDHTGMFHNFLQESDTADGLRLPAPRFTVTGILAPVTLSAGLRHLVPDFGIDHGDKVIQLSRDLIISLFRQVFHKANLLNFRRGKQ